MDWKYIVDHFGWIVSVISLLGVIFTILIAYGGLKEKILGAASSAKAFRAELYVDGTTVFVPRNEYLPERQELMDLIKQVRDDIRTDCSMRRSECQTMFCNKVDVLRGELREYSKTMATFQANQQANIKGVVAIHAQLSLLLRSMNLKVTAEDKQLIADVKQAITSKEEDEL
jgi:hypothetical protein